MDAATDIAEPDADAPECVEARQARHRRILRELAEIGMQIARAVRDEALARAEAAEGADAAPASAGVAADPGLTYSRIAKAVRLTLALESRIAEGLEKARVERERRRVDAAYLKFEQHQDDIRGFVARAVEADAAERKAPRQEVETLLEELDERLEAGEWDEALTDTLADGPIADLVERICEDLGIVPDWRVWDDQDWGIERLRAGLPDDIGADRWTDVYRLPGAPPPGAHGPPPDPG